MVDQKIFTRSRARLYTPPLELSTSEGIVAQTPQHSVVLAAKVISQELGIHIPKSLVQRVSGLHPQTQSRIISSHQARTSEHRPDSGPYPLGSKPVITT